MSAANESDVAELKARLESAELLILRACDCLGEATATLAQTDANGEPLIGTFEAVEHSVQQALLNLWRYRWQHGPCMGHVDPIQAGDEEESTDA